jgi:HEAT repeat protein
LFTSLGFLYFICVFIFRNRISAKASKVASKKKIMAPMISNFLFYEVDATKDEKNEYIALKVEIRELLKEPFNRVVLSEILLDLQKDVSGDARHRLFKLYQNLDLHIDAFKKLKSWRWEVVSKGILELTQMQVKNAYGFIKNFINDKRGLVRKQAQIATVTLKQEGISYFLDTAKYHISEWQQLKLLEVLQNIEDFSPPRFKAWLTSTNRDVVLFALRLIKHYNQNDADLELVELVKHRNDKIKSEAIQCIKEFNVTEAIDTLKIIFKKSKVEIKLQILDTISSLGNEEDIEFLKTIVNKELNFIVKSKAISTINTIAPGTFVPTEGIGEYNASENTEINVENNSTQLTEIMDDNDLKDEESLTSSGQKEDAMEWQHYLIPEFEDEIIFDHCFMEELEDILSEFKESEQELNFLPLDFLPIVSKNNELDAQMNDQVGDDDFPEASEIDEEESFKIELEEILNKIKAQDSSNDEAVNDDSESDFLPLVVKSTSEESSEFSLGNIRETILALEVYDEEVFIEKEISNLFSEVPDNSEFIEQKSIDWKAFMREPAASDDMKQYSPFNATLWNKDFEAADEEDFNSIPEFSGFSIFQELFRTCDTESKLILLDEVLAVGDEKEVCFLKTLLDDDNKKVRAKAHAVLKELLEILTPLTLDETNEEHNPLNTHDPEHLFSNDEDTEMTRPLNNIPPGVLGKENANINPLEECFLNDSISEINEEHEQLFELDFELMDTAMEEVKKGLQLNETDNKKIKKKEEKIFSSLLRNIILFPEKIIEKLNG